MYGSESLQIRKRIHGLPVFPHLEVEMMGCRAPGVAHKPHDIAPLDALALFDAYERAMSVQRDEPVFVIDEDDVTVSAVAWGFCRADIQDDAVLSREDGRAFGDYAGHQRAGYSYRSVC